MTMHKAEVDVAASATDAVAAVRDAFGSNPAKMTRARLVEQFGPGGGCPVVEVSAPTAPMARFLLAWYGGKHGESDLAYIGSLCSPPIDLAYMSEAQRAAREVTA